MAISANGFIISSADFKIILKVGQISYPLLTVDDFSMGTKTNNEIIHAVGQAEPIGNKANSEEYSGGLKLQLGEFQTALAAFGLGYGNQIKNATIAIASLPTSSVPFSRIYSGVNINDESIDVKAKSAQTLVDLKWNASQIVIKNGTLHKL